MNLTSEKKYIIRRINEVEDPSVIDAVKDLDFAQTICDDKLKAELEIALMQSANREVRPHDVVWAEIKTR